MSDETLDFLGGVWDVLQARGPHYVQEPSGVELVHPCRAETEPVYGPLRGWEGDRFLDFVLAKEHTPLRFVR